MSVYSLATLKANIAAALATNGSGNITAATLRGQLVDTIDSLSALDVAGFANPMTSAGDLIAGGAAGAATRLPKGTDGHVLTLVSGAPAWAAPAAAPSAGTKTYAVFDAMRFQPPASAYATFDTRNSIAVLDFDAASDESAFAVGVLPESAVVSSGLKVRIHWLATTATSGNVRWRVAFEKMTTDLDADSFDTAAEATGAANGTSGIETITEIAVTTIDSLTAGDIYRLRITRVGTDATNDTMSGDAELLAVEVRSAA